MSTLENTGISPGTGDQFTYLNQGGTTSPSEVVGRRPGSGSEGTTTLVTSTSTDNTPQLQQLLDAIAMNNVGAGAGVFANRSGNMFNFKSIRATGDLTLNATTTEIVLGVNAPELPSLEVYLHSTAAFTTDDQNKFLRVKADGTGLEFVEVDVESTIFVAEHERAHYLSGDGSLLTPLDVNVEVADPNAFGFDARTKNLFAEIPAGSGMEHGEVIVTSTLVDETATIAYTGDGIDPMLGVVTGDSAFITSEPFRFNVKVSAEAGNDLIIEEDGLFVSGSAGPVGPQGPTGPQGSAGAGLLPDEYGDLTEAKIIEIESADVDWIFLVNPNSDNRTNDQEPVGLEGDMERHVIRFDSTTGEWKDYGFLTGVAGPIGPQGIQGPAGPAGAQGIQGPVGPVGPIGPAGTNGTNGIDGQDGQDGAPGPQGPQGIQGDPGPAGPAGADGQDGEGVPEGGTTGQVLTKASNNDGDVEWTTISGGALPPGGTAGQVLTKTSNAPGAATWETPAVSAISNYIINVTFDNNNNVTVLSAPPGWTVVPGSVVGSINVDMGTLVGTPKHVTYFGQSGATTFVSRLQTAAYGITGYDTTEPNKFTIVTMNAASMGSTSFRNVFINILV